MHRKLTLRLDEVLIQKVKRFSKKSGKSVSQMVADYFSLIEQEIDPDRKEITPRVRSLFGALAGSKVSENDYKRHLEAKHQ
jgi:hemerythrin-like domain-containing protein